MRDSDERQDVLFRYRSIEDRIPVDHPLRTLRRLVDPVLVSLSPRSQASYAAGGRSSIPPEYLLRALLLQAVHTIRSKRQLREQLDCTLLHRWFVGLTSDDAVWVPIVFSKNRDRLLARNIVEAFFNAVLAFAERPLAWWGGTPGGGPGGASTGARGTHASVDRAARRGRRGCS